MEPGPAHRRRRPAVACSECRRRKIRCDRGFPCGPCRKSLPMLSCIYHSQPRPVPRTNTAGSSASSISSSALPHAHASQHQLRPPTSGSNSSSHIARHLDLAKVDPLGFDPDAFAGIGQIGLDWQPSWQQNPGLVPPTAYLAEAEAEAEAEADTASEVDYFAFPTFPIAKNCIQKKEDRHQTSRGYLGPSEMTRHSPTRLPMAVCSDYGDDVWYATLRRIPKLTSLVDGMSNTADAAESQQESQYHRTHKSDEGNDTLGPPPLACVVIKLQQAQLEKEQCDREGLARLSPLLKRSSKIQQLLPPRQACRKLVNTYFETFGSVFCILDTTEFFDDLEQLWEKRDASQTLASTGRDEFHKEAFAHKLLVIVALGSVTSPGHHGEVGGTAEAERTRQASRRNHAIICVQYTRQWLAEKMARGIRADIDIAQILCLLALARLTQLHTDPSPRRPSSNSAVLLTGDHDLARLGMQMGLHREPPHSPLAANTSTETEIRRRLWATMLELSLHQYLDAGLPPPLSTESYGCAAPSSGDSEDDFRSYLTPGDKRVPASSMLAALSRTQRLRLRILQHLHAPDRSMGDSESQHLAIELTRACNAEECRLLRSDAASPPTHFQLWLLNILTRPFVLVLSNVPTSANPEDTLSGYFLRRLNMENIVSILQPNPHQDTLSHTHPHTPAHHNPQTAAHSKKGAIAYPFLPTPSTAEPSDETASRYDEMHRAACTTLRVGGGLSYFAVVHRQLVATLCAEVVTEIQDGSSLFPVLDRTMRYAIVAILADAVGEYREQVRLSGGVDACSELVLFAAAHGLATALIACGDSDGSHEVDVATWTALRYCCMALGEPADTIPEMEWQRTAVDTAAAKPRHRMESMSGVNEENDNLDAQLMHKVDFLLEQQDHRVRGLDIAAVDTEIANMWAFDDDESYFSIDITL